jgi:hypothetical protein
MNPKLIALQARREILVSAAAAQRQTLALEILPLRAPLALVDQGLAVVRTVRQHPQWLVGAVAVYAVIRPRGIGVWLQRGWVVWRLAQSLRLR